MQVEATDVSVAIDGVPIVSRATLTAPSGSVVGLIGPNGSGKSTLLRAVHRELRPHTGRVLLDGDDVHALTARAAARRTAVVAQDDRSGFEFTVREVVELGRIPHQGPLGRETAADRAAVADALARARVTALADRLVDSLSGGERQRVFLARALAQQTPVLVLDEPTNHLDIAARIELMQLLRGLGATVVAALHDLDLAAAYCDQLYVLADGRLVAHGEPADVLTPDLLRDVYGVAAQCTVNPLTGRPALHFAALDPAQELVP